MHLFIILKEQNTNLLMFTVSMHLLLSHLLLLATLQNKTQFEARSFVRVGLSCLFCVCVRVHTCVCVYVYTHISYINWGNANYLNK